MGNKIAPRASDRYFLPKMEYKKSPFAGGILDDGNLPRTIIITGNDGDFFHDPSQITRTILGKDTTYEEKAPRLKFIPVNGRKASSKDKDKTEYNILKKRFNTGYLEGILRELLTYPTYQQGGRLNMDEQQLLQQQVVELVQKAMSGDLAAVKQVEYILQMAQTIQAVAQQMQQEQQGQQVREAKFGAKLNYIKLLRGQCPEGYEPQYFKSGGLICKRCRKKQQRMEQGGSAPTNAIGAFKCGRKMKKKCEVGGSVETDKCGNKLKKKK